jgi:hypothetical protein
VQILKMGLKRPELSPRELAVTFTGECAYFISEAGVYRLLKAYDLITSTIRRGILLGRVMRHASWRPNR